MSQKEFAAEVGISSVYLCQVEKGSESLGHNVGLKILDRFRKEMAEQNITLEGLLRGIQRAA